MKPREELRINKIAGDSMVDGPGHRTVIWFQGCSILCPGCQNKELWPANQGQGITAYAAAWAMKDANERAGYSDKFTITGGEPFDQPDHLLTLVSTLRRLVPSAHIIVYSGYTWEFLIKKPEARQVLRHVDILVDGPYQPEQDDDYVQWRGSYNQQVILASASVRRGHLDNPLTLDWNAPVITISNGQVMAAGGLIDDMDGLGEGNEIARCGQAVMEVD